ncbi:MAG: hypothetical protein K0R28_745 [Paenibacillus sp.]|jgi:hypothetical protein|nr:hypothetical protein [Paenibacillus sp.]
MIDLLRHFLVSLEYRFAKVIHNAPLHYPTLYIGHGVRSPHEILSHLNDVLRYAQAAINHGEILKQEDSTWDEEVERFFRAIKSLDEALINGLPDQERIAERLLQGPLSDAMTHIGQLSMLRRVAGSPISAENFFLANITRNEE